MTLPTVTDEWIVESASKNDFSGLRLNRSIPIGPIGDDEVLLEIKAVSLNYRDCAIARDCYLMATKFPLVPTSDASGIVLAVGSSVTSVSVGKTVCVLPVPMYQSGHLTVATHHAPGDGIMLGYLRRHLIVPASWVAPVPDYLTFAEISTLGTAGLTAWNIIFGAGLPSAAGGGGPRATQKRDWVVTQGTGAVSLYAAAFAVHAGAIVIGTTSSNEKAPRLTELGVSTVINYREDPKWGETARSLTPDGEGVDLVADVGGAGTLSQSLKAIRYEGTVAISGFLSGDSNGPSPSLMETLPRAANVRGILCGSRAQFEEMVSKMDEWKLKPVIDPKHFGFKDVKNAYEYLWSQKHVGKVVVSIDGETSAI